MSIRARLTLWLCAILLGVIARMGGGILLTQWTLATREASNQIALIEGSLKRTASDALLQADDLLLVGNIKFLESQYPPLAFAEIRWKRPPADQTITVGFPPQGAAISRRLTVKDPFSPSKSITIAFQIARAALDSKATQSVKRIAKMTLFSGTAAFIFFVVFAFEFAKSLTAPLGSLATLAEEIGRGRFGRKLPWRSRDEIGRFVEAFNAMSERLATLDESKKNFVSSVTHELRSPLGAIESFMPLIEGALDDPSTAARSSLRVYLDRVRDNIHRLRLFVEDLLTSAAIERGSMTCLLAPMSIPGISRDILNLFQAKAENLEVTLREEMPSGLPLVMGDADKLRHVVVNLVHNALKYTPAGGTVTIAAAREGEHVWLSVSDTGTGIDAEDISKLFKLFSKGRNSDRTQDGSQGTGLGLYIVKSIIEKHGGEVRVRSEPRAGTTIGFSLKITAIKQEGAAREAPHSGQGGLS